MINQWIKRNSTHLIIAAIFVTISLVYFKPALEGKVIVQQDVVQAKAMAHEIMVFKDKDGKAPLWTNAMFGGMPSYLVWAPYPCNVTQYIINTFRAIFPHPAEIVLLYLLGAYFLCCVLGVSAWLAAVGAIAYAFSSYNFIIIEAGHESKAFAIALFAPIIASILVTLKQRHVMRGATLTALFLALEIHSGHIQMTYYLFMALLILVGIELFHAIQNKQVKVFCKAIVYLSAAVILAVGVNASQLWTTYEYGQESIRGKPNLEDHASATSTGLDKDYAYQWSQGVMENLTFLIPNAYGGASHEDVNESSEIVKFLSNKGVPQDQAISFAKQLPTYWGNKPFTAGPIYFGSIICFLFLLGLFIVKTPIKWWIVAATLLSLFLSFGKNFPLVSDLFFDYFPLYNKFRTVESILVIAGALVPILAVLALKEVANPQVNPKDLQKPFMTSLAIITGILLLTAGMPDLFLSFKTPNHPLLVQQLTQAVGGQQELGDAIANALIKDRINMAQADAMRSLAFVLVGAGVAYALMKRKLKPQAAFIALGIIILIDMWNVNRRYLNDNCFTENNIFFQHPQEREVDRLILKDKSLDYRVLDLSYPVDLMIPNTYASAISSYYHKTVGGYHAAKLRRFQELIDHQLTNPINQHVLDMLNTKYIIVNSKDGKTQSVIKRDSACGNAWFVSKIQYVKDAKEEMSALNQFDPKKEAVVSQTFRPLIKLKQLVSNSATDSIKLISYRPDHLIYSYSALNPSLAVLSEVWYSKGWKAYVDHHQKIPIFRANYVLRAVALPAGKHQLELRFEPGSYYIGEKISLVFSALLLVSLAFMLYKEWKQRAA